MLQKHWFANAAVRVVIFLFWSCVIALLLLTPRVSLVARNSISIFAWPGVFSEEYISLFERETGIKVYVSYYASNEELLVKLRATGGRGYDLVVPSDYAVKKLIDEGLLKRIDKQKLDFVQVLNPLLMGHPFDASNDYALPFVWELSLIGVTKNFMQHARVTPEHAWDLVFRPGDFGLDYRLIMVNDPIEAIAAAAYYRFGTVASLSIDQETAVKELLRAQRPWVEAYSNVRSDYYLGTHNAMAALSHSAEIWRASRDYSDVDFIVPRDTFVTIEHCALPVGNTKDDLVYQFLNFFYTERSFQHHFDLFKTSPARRDVIDTLQATAYQKAIMISSQKDFAHYIFVRDILSEQSKQSLWISIKS